VTWITNRARRWMFPAALGFSDGILNALILASTSILNGGTGITIGLTVRVGCVAFVTAIVTMFIAEYGELRSRLSRSTHQLNLSVSGHLAATQLGRQVRYEAAQAAAVASGASFVGAVIPLLIGSLLPNDSWIGLVVAIVLLGVLGVILADSVDGQRWRWSTGLIGAGLLVAAIGSQLNIT
jgi:VIT1/CCC1 family predicted Fe2+/Mn2+ transporter